MVIMPPGPVSTQEIGEVVVRHQVETLWLTAGLFDAVVASALRLSPGFGSYWPAATSSPPIASTRCAERIAAVR